MEPSLELAVLGWGATEANELSQVVASCPEPQCLGVWVPACAHVCIRAQTVRLHPCACVLVYMWRRPQANAHCNPALVVVLCLSCATLQVLQRARVSPVNRQKCQTLFDPFGSTVTLSR